MPLVNGNGPSWSRPLVRDAEDRLWGLNPVRRFLATLFGRKLPERPAPRTTLAARLPDEP